MGVVGVGALGQHHARVYAGLPGAQLAGVYDVDQARAAEVAGRHGTRVFAHLRDLLDEVDAVSVAVPTVDHHRVARVLLDAGKDVLVEKPMTTTVAEAEDLIRVAAERGAILQVGHIERFNPA
ncbi:MAG TPA: Gfo/Idh/MocA family oxidoreductase, partial [Vicinamibacteria bacterium]|nr:Gfo/Idh/MocA family oxidoreductase [Vicinamibacteria bacterium]